MSKFIEVVTATGSAYVRKDHITGVCAQALGDRGGRMEVVTLNGGVWMQYYSTMDATLAGVEEVMVELDE